MSDRSWTASFERSGTTWGLRDVSKDTGLRKRHGLQGPIDDAFMDSFIFVRPTGVAARPELCSLGCVRAWTEPSVNGGRHFRGDAAGRRRYGNHRCRIAAPTWSSGAIRAAIKSCLEFATNYPSNGARTLFQSAEAVIRPTHVPVLIYPNPLNPKRYVVLNSGFTYREVDYLTNAREVPKLPDWAVIDTSTPADAHYPGKVVMANFFDEHWQVLPAQPHLH